MKKKNNFFQKIHLRAQNCKKNRISSIFPIVLTLPFSGFVVKQKLNIVTFVSTPIEKFQYLGYKPNFPQHSYQVVRFLNHLYLKSTNQISVFLNEIYLESNRFNQRVFLHHVIEGSKKVFNNVHEQSIILQSSRSIPISSKSC